MVLQSIYSHGAYSRKALAFHLTSPLLEQRERFLLHLQKEGATQRTLKRVEQGLLKTIRCLGSRNSAMLESKKYSASAHVGKDEIMQIGLRISSRRRRDGCVFAIG